MGHLPLPASRGPGHQIPVPPPTSRPPIPQLESVAVLASLRETLSATTRPPENIFRNITDSARILTGAEGIALALRTGTAVICRARSGNLAPEIGDQVNAGSGISGECLRTSRALRCDDTRTDDRVDPEVCRNLGIRSIAVMPLSGRDGTVGILEAFAARPYAFGAEQMSLLRRLAEVAQAAYEAECGMTEPSPEPRVETSSLSRIRELFSTADPLAAATVTASEVHSAAELLGERAPSTRRYWIAAAVIFLLLTTAVIWTTWHEPDEDTVSPQQVTQPQSVSDEAAKASSPALIPWKPPAGRPALRTSQPGPGQVPLIPDSTKPALQNAAEIQDEKIRPTDGEAVVAGTALVADRSDSSSLGNIEPPSAADSMPAVESASTNAALANLASTPTKLPDAEIPVSQGVSEATLVHQVQPIYPAEARSQRMEGSVVLELTIGEDGSTRDLKAVSGPPVLVRAATEAVRQWRYRPALLNGKRIVAQKQITVIFKAP
jgi:TonB family protein